MEADVVSDLPLLSSVSITAPDSLSLRQVIKSAEIKINNISVFNLFIFTPVERSIKLLCSLEYFFQY
jgi:hypothetical protein